MQMQLYIFCGPFIMSPNVFTNYPFLKGSGDFARIRLKSTCWRAQFFWWLDVLCWNFRSAAINFRKARPLHNQHAAVATSDILFSKILVKYSLAGLTYGGAPELSSFLRLVELGLASSPLNADES